MSVSSQAPLPAHLYSTLSKVWTGPEGYIYLRQDVADAPSKDYFQLIIKEDLSVSFRVWRILPPFTHSSDISPIAFLSTYESFSKDVNIREAIQSRLKGELGFVDNILAGRFDFLQRLDKSLQLNIIGWLDVCSVLRLGVTSKSFKLLCDSSSIWQRHFNAGILRYYTTPRLMEVVGKDSWKAFYIIMSRIAMVTDKVGTDLILKKIASSELKKINSARRQSSRASYSTQSNSARSSFARTNTDIGSPLIKRKSSTGNHQVKHNLVDLQPAQDRISDQVQTQ